MFSKSAGSNVKIENQLCFSDKPRQRIKKQRHHFADKGPPGESYDFPSSHALLGGSSKPQRCPAPVSDAPGLGRGLGTYISLRFPGAAATAGTPGRHPESCRCGRSHCREDSFAVTPKLLAFGRTCSPVQCECAVSPRRRAPRCGARGQGSAEGGQGPPSFLKVGGGLKAVPGARHRRPVARESVGMEAQRRRTPPPRPVAPRHAGWTSERCSCPGGGTGGLGAGFTGKVTGFRGHWVSALFKRQNGRTLMAVSALSPALFTAGRRRRRPNCSSLRPRSPREPLCGPPPGSWTLEDAGRSS